MTERLADNSAKSLKIGIISTPLAEGGVATHLKGVISRLRERGHTVTFVTTNKYAGIIKADIVKTYSYLPFPTKLYGFMPSAIWGIFRVLRDCDIVNIYGYPNFLTDYLTITRPFHKKPLVITLAGSFHQFTSSNIYFLKRMHNACMLKFQRFVDKFIAVSQAEKNEVIKRGVAEGKVRIVYSAVSDKYLKITGENRRTIEKRILYLGRLTSSKNPELLVEAIEQVVRRNNNVKLILAGPDFGERRNLEALVSKLGIRKHVEFSGWVSEEKKLELFDSCHVFIHPSLQDILALTVLEASMAGLPTIAFNVGGNSEMIVNGQTGVLVDHLSPEALSDAILEILNSGDLADKMGKQAREYVSSKFLWERVVTELEEVYYEAVGLKVNIGRNT